MRRLKTYFTTARPSVKATKMRCSPSAVAFDQFDPAFLVRSGLSDIQRRIFLCRRAGGLVGLQEQFLEVRTLEHVNDVVE